jgi:hypothetical protein
MRAERSDRASCVRFGLANVLHEPFDLAPPNEILLSKESGLFRGDHVVTNFLLPWSQSDRSGLTQACVILGCQIPKQFYSNVVYHEPSPIRCNEFCDHPHLLKHLTAFTKGLMSTGFFRTV